MKKIILTFLLSLLFTVFVKAQLVSSVVGLDFGIFRSTAIKHLTNRFGSDYDVYGERLIFYNVTIGTINYDFAEFYFKNNEFVTARFAKKYSLSNIASAKKMRDEIFNEYKDKL